MATNLLTGKEKNVAEEKPQNLLPEFTQIQENSNGISNVERGKNLFSIANETSEKYKIPIKTAINYEDTKSKSDLIGGLTVFLQGLKRLPRELQSSVLKLHQGAEGASVVDKNWMQRFLTEADTDSDKFMADIFAKYGETTIVPKVPIKITDVAALPQNLAFSIVSMGSGAAAGIPIGLLPVPGARVAAWTLGTVASGKAAYEMTTYEIMQSYLELMDEQSIKETGKGLTLEREKELKGIFNFEAMKYGLWEAVPEALSNLAFAKLLTIPLTKMVGKGIAGKIINKIVGVYGEELITETITQIGQVRIEQRAGLREGEEGISVIQAFKEIAPQTFLLTTVMAGAGSSAVAIKNRVTQSFENEILAKKLTPENESIVRQGLEEHIGRVIEEQGIIKGIIDKKTLESTTGEPQTFTEEEQKVIERAEIEAPEGVGEAEPGVEGVEEGVTLEEPVVEAVKKLRIAKISTVSSGFIENLPAIGIAKEGRWDIVLRGRIPSEMQKEFRDAGFEVKVDKDARLTHLLLPADVGKQDTARAKAMFDKGIEKFLVPEKIPIPGEEKQLLEDIKELEERKLYGQIPKIIKKETTILREKIANIERGIREGRITTKKEIKETQAAVIKLLESTELAAADRAKFIKTIKNIQTPEQLQKALPEIKDRMIRLEIAAEKRGIAAKIKKELKTTKPLKVGDRRVGKFNYETNKMFDTLRDYNKLTQEKAQAEFDKFPEEVETEVDLIKKRFLSLKANGASALAEIHKQVYADIMRIKRLGQEAKDEADLEKKLNRQERVENALSSIDKITGTKKSIIGKIINAYRKGFSNIYSMLNSIAGKDFAEAYNPELSENRRNTGTYRKTLEITREASRIYNEKNVMRMFETMSQKDYQITDVADGLTTELSKLEIVDIYNSLKNDKKKQDYYEAFGEDQVETLMRKLTPQDVTFGDMLQEAVQGYREILNKRNIETTGRDLGFIENYWPATSEFQVSVIDDMRVQGETPSALKERAKTRVIPVPKNAWYKAQRHVAQAEHVANVSREYEVLKRLFTDRKVKHAITEKYGKDVYNTVMAQIDNVSLNKQTERIDAISSMFQRAINNWVTAKIALNPSTYVRQLMSVGNYAENMNASEWTAGFFKGILSPKETFNFVWNNAPFLEARFNKGYSEALKEAIEGAERISVNKRVWTKFLTALVRSGDVTAIIYGGAPLIRSELAKGKSMQEAIDTFEQATLKSQQSGLSTSISQFQNSRNPFTRLFLAFKNTSNQYFRKMADAVITYQNGDISLEQFAKTMAIYAVIQPILYVAAGYATKAIFSTLGMAIGIKEDDEDFEELMEKFLNDIMVQIIVGPVNAMPIIDDVVRTAGRKLTDQKIYKVFSTPLFDDLERGFRALTKKEVTGGDYFNTATSILEPTTALPIATAIRYYEILTGKKISAKKSGKKLVR